MKHFFQLLLLSFIALASFGQNAGVEVTQTVKDISSNEKLLIITAKAKPGVKIISTKPLGEDLPINSKLTFSDKTKALLVGDFVEKGVPVKLKTEGTQNVTAYEEVSWEQKIKLADNDTNLVRLEGTLDYYREDENLDISPFKEPISRQTKITATAKATTNGNGAAITHTKPAATALEEAKKNYEYKSLWALFLGALGLGFIAFLTPCVYALVPVTVSMFLKRSKTPEQGRNNVFLYAFSIVTIFTFIGILTGSLFTQDQLYALSTHWIFNLFIFILFVVFGLSFLGWFEIQLPNKWANAANSKADMNSLVGIFFMALTLVIVSFSCTSIFVANLLTTGAAIFGKAGPILGLLGFGLGLAAPFMILALKPGWLTVLTKSGGWQNALKVTLGFLELALALKFLSNADLDQQWRILDREVFLVLWIVLFGLLGFYLLGKLRFHHDSDLPKNDWGLEYIPVPRLMLAIASLAFAIYLIPGLWGAPLKQVSAFVPPMGTQDFIVKSASSSGSSASAAPPPVKYVNDLKIYHPEAAINNDLVIYHDYDEALAAAKILKKPLMLDFTGIQCNNCRKFEGAIWPAPEVISRMKNDFVIASLFTDYKAELDDTEKGYSQLLEQKINTVGDKYKDLQMKLINTVAQPNYVFVDLEGKLLHPKGYGYEPSESVKSFVNHLDMVKAEFAKRNP